MRPRLLILDLISPDDGQGLAAHVTAAGAVEVSPYPVATGVVRPDGTVVATPAKALAAAIEAGFARTVDGMLIGALASYWQVRALVAALHLHLPETLVYAPLGGNTTPRLGSWARDLLRRSVLPEATVAVVAASRFSELVEAPGAADMPAKARAVVDAGAHACWLRDDGGGARAIDVLAWEAQIGLLDCPPPASGAAPEVAVSTLAGLLAHGLPLREAIERAQAAGSRLGSDLHRAIR